MTKHTDRDWATFSLDNAASSAAELGTDNGFLRVKDPRQRALLRILSFAYRNRVAAAPLVERLACEYQDAESVTLRQVAYLLASDVSPISALEQTRGAVDETTLLALRLAEETGTLAGTYELCLRDDFDARFQTDDPAYSPTAQLLQRAIGIFVACFVLTFLAIFIVPTFLRMMDEFGLAMPRFPVLLLELYESFGFLLLLFSMAAIAWLMVLALWFRNWQWKPWKAVYPSRPAAVRLRALLALVVGSGRPVVAAIETLTRFQGSSVIRNRLVAATQSMNNGENPWSALASQKLLSPHEAHALMLAPDGSTEYWLLQQSAVSSAHRHETVLAFLLQSVSLFLLIVLAVVVGATAISFFMVLCVMISGLT
jgi:type II secretory pathway component PulF